MEKDVINFYTGKTIQGYLFIKAIGMGATCIVFEGKDSYNFKVAIKVIYMLDELYINREYGANKKLEHHNIVRLLAVFKNAPHLCFVFEYCDSGSLHDYYLANQHEFNEELCVQIISDLVKGYSYINSEGIIHRDIKSCNIMLSKVYGQLTAKLGDFGYARRYLEIEEPKNLTHLGTVPYMSPEMLDSSMSYNYKTDIFAIGVVFFEILFGYYPMHPLTSSSAKHKIYEFYKEGVIKVDTSHVRITEHSLDFISRCLQFEIGNRISIQDLAFHPLLTKTYTELMEKPYEKPTATIIINTL